MAMVLDIQAALDGVARSLLNSGSGNAVWTNRIKEELTELGSRYRCWVYTSGCEKADGGEWLYDLSWLNYSDKELLDVELAAESEWNSQSLEDDFLKLVVARAKLRLFIFQARSDQHRLSSIDRLKVLAHANIRACVGDEYLFSCYREHDHDFVHEHYVLSRHQPPNKALNLTSQPLRGSAAG